MIAAICGGRPREAGGGKRHEASARGSDLLEIVDVTVEYMQRRTEHIMFRMHINIIYVKNRFLLIKMFLL